METEFIIKLYKQSLSEIGLSKEDYDTILSITLKNVKDTLIDPIRRKYLRVPDVTSIETVLKEETMYLARRHKDLLEMNKKRNC